MSHNSLHDIDVEQTQPSCELNSPISSIDTFSETPPKKETNEGDGETNISETNKSATNETNENNENSDHSENADSHESETYSVQMKTLLDNLSSAAYSSPSAAQRPAYSSPSAAQRLAHPPSKPLPLLQQHLQNHQPHSPSTQQYVQKPSQNTQSPLTNTKIKKQTDPLSNYKQTIPPSFLSPVPFPPAPLIVSSFHTAGSVSIDINEIGDENLNFPFRPTSVFSILPPIVGGTSSPVSIDSSVHELHEEAPSFRGSSGQDTLVKRSMFQGTAFQDTPFQATSFRNGSIADMNIDKFYNDNTASRPIHTELTLLSLYIKSQKHLYKRSATYYRFQHAMGSVPNFILSSLSALLTTYTKTNPWIPAFIACANAYIALVIALLHFFNPEVKENTCTFMADSLNGLEIKVNMMQSDLTGNPSADIRGSIRAIEKEMVELAQTHKTCVPNIIHDIMPLISYISIFTFIRYINEYKCGLYSQYVNTKTEISQIHKYWTQKGVQIQFESIDPSVELTAEQQIRLRKDIARLHIIEQVKNKTKDGLAQYQTAFNNIDELYSSEIRFAESHNVLFHYLFGKWMRQKRDRSHLHIVIQRVLDNYNL